MNTFRNAKQNVKQQRFALVPRVGRAGDQCHSWERAALRSQLCIVYIYAGIAKLNSDWLLHAEPMASKLVTESFRHHATLRGLLCRHEVATAVCSRVARVGARVR